MSGPASEDLGPLSFRAWVGLVVVLHLALALLLWQPTMFEGGDNAGYMILGEALRGGHGYRDLYLPGEPIHSKYPPVYPAVLAVLGWLGGLQLLKLVSAGFTAGAVALAAGLGRRAATPVVGLAVAGVLAVNPVLLEYAHWVLSEAPFVFLVMLALVLLSLERSRWRMAGIGVAALAFLTRTAGLPLLVAAVLVSLLERRRREAAVAIGIGLTAAVGWAVWQRLADPSRPDYLGELALRNPYDPAAGSVGFADLLGRAAENVWTYASSVIPHSLLGGGGGPETGVPATLLGLVVVALALVGWTARATRRLGYPELFAFLYTAMIALWPSVWTDRRFLLPLLPLLLLYACTGAGATLRWARRPRSGSRGPGMPGEGRWRGLPAVVGVATLLAVPGLVDAARLAPERARCLAQHRAGQPCITPALASFYAAARWAGEGTDPDAVIANRKPRLFYLIARRKGDVYRFSAEPELVLRDLEAMGATHVVVDRLSATTARYLLPAIQERRDRFEVVYLEGEPPTAILRFHPPPETALGRPR